MFQRSAASLAVRNQTDPRKILRDVWKAGVRFRLRALINDSAITNDD